jgi:uncharacterized protein with von Willebrand factor type A (vWA) domain
MTDGGFTELFVAFGHELREAGLPIGTDDVMTMCTSLAELDPSDIMDTYWAGRCTLVSRREHIPVYDHVFRRFFLDEHVAPEDPRVTLRASTNSQGVLEVPDNETRDRPADAGRNIHVRRMVRETMRRHGDPERIILSERQLRVRPLILLLDVSGSMSDYSRNLLQFAYSTRRAAGRVEVFCFGTRLSRITRQLDRRRPDDAMAAAAASVFDWDGGTRIGDSVTEFVRTWARPGRTRGGIVVICSDGLDRGDPETLATAMEQLSRCCHRIVWLNPHHGDDPEYRPTTMGMMVAEPYIDQMLSGHSLHSLENFARALPALR